MLDCVGDGVGDAGVIGVAGVEGAGASETGLEKTGGLPPTLTGAVGFSHRYVYPPGRK